MGKKDDRYYMSSVKLGPKGQIVIPKEARAMFGLEPGDTLVLLADTKKGIALQTADKLNPLLRRVFQQLPGHEGDVIGGSPVVHGVRPVVQTGAVDEGGVVHPQLLRPLVHHGDEGAFAARDRTVPVHPRDCARRCGLSARRPYRA